MSDTAAVSRRALLAAPFREPSRPPSPLQPSPPGTNEASLAACTGCAACVPVCPTHIIAMADAKPRLDFTKGECVFCGACAKVCPEPVFTATRPPVFQHVVRIADSCLALRGIACMTCRDACPSNAIRFRPRVGGPFTPEVLETSCNGCGACIAPCPAQAIGVAQKKAQPAPEAVHA